jgi:mRNA interferase YafQ
LLAETGTLPPAYRPHRLSREWAGAWECHIEPDWLLIYTVIGREVVLVRTGTHRDLFG